MGLAPDAGAETFLCWYRIWLIFIGMSLILAGSTLAHAAIQADIEGLLPPASTDHSQAVIPIREALRANNLPLMSVRIDELIRHEPTNFEGYLWRGFLDLQQHNYGDAVSSLRRAESLEVNSYVLRLLAFSYYFLGQFRLFTLTMGEAIQKQPTDFAPYFYLGRYYASTDAANFTLAADYFQEALKRNPNHYAAHYYLGYCYEAERKLKDADREYNRSIQLADVANQQFALPHQGMARLRLLQTKPEDALPFARRAVETAPNDAASHVVLARVYTMLGDTAQAVPEWERAAALGPTDPLPWFHLYQAYAKLGKKSQASRAFAQYQKLMTMYGNN